MGLELNLGPTFSFIHFFMFCSPFLMLCSFLCVVVFFFTLLISSLPYCSFLHATLLLSFLCFTTTFLFVLLLFSSHYTIVIFIVLHYCYPFHTIALLFVSCYYFPLYIALLLSYSPCYSLLRPTWLSFHVLAFIFDYSFISGIRFFTLLLLVCCYSLKNLVLLSCIPSCKNCEWLGVKKNKFVFFPLLISIFYFFISCLLFFCFCFSNF
jgi:hypothetical protein